MKLVTSRCVAASSTDERNVGWWGRVGSAGTYVTNAGLRKSPDGVRALLTSREVVEIRGGLPGWKSP
jgi:hypothetical protein